MLRLLILLPARLKACFILVVVLAVCVAASELKMFSLLSEVLTGSLVDKTKSPSQEELFGLIALVLFVGFGRVAVIAGTNYFAQYSSHTVLKKVFQQAVFGEYLNLTRKSDHLISLLAGRGELVATRIYFPLINVVSNLIFLFAFSLAMLKFAPDSVLYAFVAIASAYVLTILLLRPAMVALGERANTLSKQLLGDVRQAFDGILEVKTYQLELSILREFEKKSTGIRRRLAMNTVLSESPRYIFESLAIVTILIALALEFSEAEQVALLGLISELILFGVVVQRTLPVIQQIYSGLSTLSGSRALIGDLLDESLVSAYGPSKKVKNVNTTHSSLDFDRIVIENVTVSIGGKAIVKGFSAEFSKGELIVMRGATGSGKTTIINVMLGLIDPSEGNVYLYKGRDRLGSASQLAPFANSAYCPQSPTIFRTDLRANLCLSNKSSVADEYHQMVTTLNLDSLAALDVLNQKSLSGGEKQRIGIARVLLADRAAIQVFDEPTSALDFATSNLVAGLITRCAQNRFVFVISHDDEEFKAADQVITL